MESLQFPVKQDKQKNEPIATSQKAEFIYSNMRAKMPSLYEMIKKSKR